MRTRLATAMMAALLGACGGGAGDAGAPEGTVVQQTLPFAEVEVNAFSGVRVARVAAVQDEASWAQLWADHTSNVSPAPRRPEVDFAQDAVAAVFLGETTQCLRPQVESVVLTGANRLRVQWRVLMPPAGEFCPTVFQGPVQMVRFGNAQRRPVEFLQLP